MKRVAKVLLVLTILIAIGYWGYKQFNKTSSLTGKIHQNADSVLKIGVQEIKETLLVDALTSPRHYLNKVSFKGSDDEDKPEQGIDLMPYNMVFYTIPDVKNALFGTFKISDSEAFELYVKQELVKKSVTIEDLTNQGYSFAKVDKSKLALAWNSEKLVVAFSLELNISQFQKVFKDILKDGKTIEDSNDPLIEALASSSDHIVYMQEESTATINFEDGKAVIAGNILTKAPQKFKSKITQETLENPSLQLYFDANFENPENKKDWIKKLSEVAFFAKNNLNVDEVLNRTNGFFSLGIEGKTIQTDTIITYGYDDNFEKVEQRSLQKKQVPKIQLNLGAENESLKDYLVSKNAVNKSGIFEPFPLYQIYVKDNSVNTVFDTFEGVIPTQEKSTNTFFGAQVNFQKLKQDLTLPSVVNYIENLNELKLSASQKEGNRITLNGELTATNSDVNILSQIAPQ